MPLVHHLLAAAEAALGFAAEPPGMSQSLEQAAHAARDRLRTLVTELETARQQTSTARAVLREMGMEF